MPQLPCHRVCSVRLRACWRTDWSGHSVATIVTSLRSRVACHATKRDMLLLNMQGRRSAYASRPYITKTPPAPQRQARRPRLSHKDYTVGWVCALPIELAAAQEMLDEEHERLPQHADDSNIYTLGRMGEHNVVMACLPAGQMGNNSAASVAVQMKSSFNAIRFGLLVGIGGGVPSAEQDVRLGDVVVSQPFREHGGVVQYDFGKTTPGGLVRTGFLNAPPTVLLNAVASLRAKHLRGKADLSSHLSRLRRLPEFLRDNAGSDVLFEPAYTHAGGVGCEQCNKEKVVSRQPRDQEIMIHYGTIASGNQVMRDAVMRDRVSSELGGVLCFEMEAAGLMNSFPCLAIRGICDYADSHKNKAWQAYAAGTAAACAKEIFSVIPAAKVLMELTADELIKEKNAADGAPCLVPFTRNPCFTGRESQLAKLEEGLFVRDQPSKIAITGLGGVGKTQLMLELAYRTKEKYKDCTIIWIPATDMESLQQAFLDVAQQLGVPGWDEEKADVKRLLQSYLSKESAGQWLLLFDNADDINMWFAKPGTEQTCGHLSDYLPKSKRGSIVFTTRDRKIAVKLARQNVIEVPEMDQHMATQLLQRYLVNQDLINCKQDTETLLAQLTYLPLAIVQAAAFINENGIAFADYLSLLADQEEEVIDLFSEEFEDDWRYHNTKNPVATTWLISFEQIRGRDPLAAAYLSFMACVDPKNIPQSLLPPGQSRKKEIDAIGTLSAYSFITRRPADLAVDVHRLVHLATRNWLRKEELLARWTVKAIARLAEVLRDTEYENRVVWRTYLPHARHALESDLVDEDREDRIDLIWIYGSCLYHEGRYNEAEILFDQVIERRKRVLGEEHPDTLTSIANLASTYRIQGRWKEAEELEVQLTETFKRVLGEEHPDTLISIANLASTYWNQGRWKEAEELFIQVIETFKRVLSEEHPDTLTGMANLALTYWNQGRLKEAEELFIQVIEIRKRVLGEEHPDTLTNIANLASTYRNQGRWKEAEELEVQLTETLKRVLGEEHPDTLGSISNLALTYRNQGRWKEAEELEVQLSETSKRVLGEEHPSTLTSIANLASTYRIQGRWKEAEELEVQSTETFKRVLGVEHPSTLTSISNLASTYGNQGRWKEAEELEVQVIETRKRVLGEEHPDTLTSIANLALTYKDQGRWKEAEELFIQLIETRKRVLGEEHPDTLASRANLASTHWNQGRWKEAEEQEVQVIETRKRVLGMEHPDTLGSMANLASTYGNQGRWKEAEELFIQVIETRKRVLGEEHPDTLTSITNLASTYRIQGRLKEAEELDIQSTETFKRVLGKEHPNTLTIMSNLALNWKWQGRDTEALELMEECVRLRTQVLGVDHPDTTSSSTILIEWQTEKLDMGASGVKE